VGAQPQQGAVVCLHYEALKQPGLLRVHRVTPHGETTSAAIQVFIHAMWLDHECHGAASKYSYYAVVPFPAYDKVLLAASLKPVVRGAWQRFGPLAQCLVTSKRL